MKPANRKAKNTIEKKGSSEDFTKKNDVMKRFTKSSKGKFMCQCCKQSFLPHFLTIDHVYGRKGTLIKRELRKFGYSEKRSGKQLVAWIKIIIDEKMIQKHFQVLCWSCNVAKFLYKTCPHQR